MNAEHSTVLPIRCEDNECGMTSAYQFYPDGSFRKIMEGCWHPKRLPNRDKIKAAIAKENKL